MSTAKTKMNRRSFLKVSMWGSAGLMVGFSWMSSFIGDEKTMNVPDEWYDINAYIKIAGDGEVTIFSPNPEIGQNVKTSMPLIVAEELDADWDKVKVEQAPLDTNKYTRQLAGGSQSIRQSWDSLRMAGATARYLLVAAAAKKWNTSVKNLSTDKGIITNKKTGETLGYGEVATAAASVPVPDEVELKDPKDFKLIGSYIKNVDGQGIVTGKPLFGLDYMPEGTPIAMIVHPPAFGMKLKSFDASEAKSMPGVYDVFTIDTSIKNPQWSDVNAFNELVVVTGKTTWQVMKAKKALNIEWEQTGELESTKMHEERMKDALKNRSGKVERQDGNPDKMRNQAAKVIERVY
ncbi:MAG TPA: molybdopterin cofactor-binding domain-containing protein, partial [Balneolaceae bacterium]|nr:molybdopterin cofactor-binding domain-containing protein [Balneolaceae bacterium]